MKIIRDRKLVHETMLVLTTAAAVFHFLYRDPYSLWVVCGLGLTGLFLPWPSEWITTLWMGFAGILGRISSTIVLTIVFFLILTPAAFFRRLFRKKEDPGKMKTNFRERNHIFTKTDIENPW